MSIYFFGVFLTAPRGLFAEYASYAKEVIFTVRELFSLFGLTKLGDSDKMIKENKASECRLRLSAGYAHSQIGERYEVNLAHTGRPAL